MALKGNSFPEFCGQRGERGVCVRPHAHCGRCENNQAKAIHLNVDEKNERRFRSIMSDWVFAVWYMAERKELLR